MRGGLCLRGRETSTLLEGDLKNLFSAKYARALRMLAKPPPRERLCKRKLFHFLPSPKKAKLSTIKNTLRFELHFRLCFGKADGADNFRLELLRGLRGSPRIAFFRTFFSKKKVHNNVTAFAGLADKKTRKTTTRLGGALLRSRLCRASSPSSRQSMQGHSACLQIRPAVFCDLQAERALHRKKHKTKPSRKNRDGFISKKSVRPTL